MTTYSQKMHRPEFDWNAFLNGKPSYDAVASAFELATSWVTCACGNQCATIPRKANGEPTDGRLSNDGAEFACALRRARDDYFEPDLFPHHMRYAKGLLVKIETRSAYIIDRVKRGLPIE